MACWDQNGSLDLAYPEVDDAKLAEIAKAKKALSGSK
jgi:hypothetical protein